MGTTGSGAKRSFAPNETSPADLVMQNKMQRRLGRLTGTCFQRCAGMDVLNTLHSVTFDLDRKNGTGYHDRFKDFLARIQPLNLLSGLHQPPPVSMQGFRPVDQMEMWKPPLICWPVM